MTNLFENDVCFYILLIVYSLLVWSISRKYSHEEIYLVDDKEEKK